MHALRHQKLACALLAALVCALGIVVFSKLRASASTSRCIDVAFDFMDYESLAAALERTDAVLVVSSTSVSPLAQQTKSTPSEVDLPVEQVSARVDRVLVGDNSLLNSTITINQYSTAVCNEYADLSRLEDQRRYVVFAQQLNESSQLWLLPLGGQGNYLIDPSTGRVSPNAGALPELVGTNFTVDELAELLN